MRHRFKDLGNYIAIGNFVIEKSTGEWLPIMAGGDIFGGQQTGQSQSGFYNLPTEMQDEALGLSGALYNQTGTNLGYSNQALQQLSQLASPNASWYTQLQDYLTQTMQSTDLSQNPYYTSAMSSYTSEFQKSLADSLAQNNAQANAAGQFYSSGASAANTNTTNNLMQTYLNNLSQTALSAEESAQSAGLSAASLSTTGASTLGGLENTTLSGGYQGISQLINLLSSMAGSSSANYGSSLFSQLSQLGLDAATVALLA